MHDAAATELKLTGTDTDLPPCPSCGGETGEEFVANGPSQGLRLSCKTCGPIDVMSFPGFDEDDDAPEGDEPESLRFASSDEAANRTPAEEPDEEEAETAVAPDPLLTDEPRFEEAPDSAELRTEESDIHDTPEETPEDDRREEVPLTAFAPAEVGARPRLNVEDPARRARNRQVLVAGLGGMAIIAALVAVDLFLRPIDPPSQRLASAPVIPVAEASVPPAEVVIPRPAMNLTEETATVPAPVTAEAASPSAPDEAEGASVPGEEASAEAPPAKPASAPAGPMKAESAIALGTAPGASNGRQPETRWFSQTGVPPTHAGKAVDPGVYSPGAAERKPPLLVASAVAPRQTTRTLVVDEPAEKPAKPVDPAWRQLRQGMTADQVARALGVPRWTTSSVAFEFWMYETRSILASGVVVFENGMVATWRYPSS